MLTVSCPLSSGQAQKYHAEEFTSRAQSYYAEGENGRGEWQGRLAAACGVTLETIDSGQPFAAVAALAGGRFPANVDAATNATIAWVPRDALFEVLAAEPAIARALIADLSQRVVNLTNVVQTLALDVPGRLARFLFQRSLAVGEATPEGLRVPLGTTKAELASSLGTVPETLSRALGRLRDEGVLEVRGTDVIVYDVGALARLGSGYEE
jgi:CRP/FNR family transcriptional regulator